MSSRLPQSRTVPEGSSARGTMLHGLRLFIVRAAWIAVAALTVVLFVASVPAYYAQIVCQHARCDVWQLQPNDIRALHDFELSADLYRIYLVALDVFYALGSFIIGAFIFWKKSNDKMALLISITLVLSGGTDL